MLHAKKKTWKGKRRLSDEQDESKFAGICAFKATCAASAHTTRAHVCSQPVLWETILYSSYSRYRLCLISMLLGASSGLSDTPGAEQDSS